MKILAYGTILFVVLLGLFVIARPGLSRQNIQKKSSVPKSTPTPIVKTFEIIVKDNKVATGAATLKVNQGDNVMIEITADVNGELHVHGYDKSIEFEKNKQAQLSFIANISGRFPYELEDTKTEIGALEVQPK